jgi:hypothetical protein
MLSGLAFTRLNKIVKFLTVIGQRLKLGSGGLRAENSVDGTHLSHRRITSGRVNHEVGHGDEMSRGLPENRQRLVVYFGVGV